ncbi:hypothetical protein EV122DRAFT_285222 [Schizophyllum commune]
MYRRVSGGTRPGAFRATSPLTIFHHPLQWLSLTACLLFLLLLGTLTSFKILSLLLILPSAQSYSLPEVILVVYGYSLLLTCIIIVDTSMSGAQLKLALSKHLAIPESFWHQHLGVLIQRGSCREVPDSSTLSELGIGPMTHVDLRLLIRGGSGEEEADAAEGSNGRGCRERRTGKLDMSLVTEKEHLGEDEPKRRKRRRKAKKGRSTMGMDTDLDGEDASYTTDGSNTESNTSVESDIEILGKEEPWDDDVWECLVAEWMVKTDQSFDEVEKPSFLAMIKYAQNHRAPLDYDMPGRKAFRHRIMQMGDETVDELKILFVELEGKVTISIDAWTSSNQHAFLAIVAHYVTNGGQLGVLE